MISDVIKKWSLEWPFLFRLSKSILLYALLHFIYSLGPVYFYPNSTLDPVTENLMGIVVYIDQLLNITSGNFSCLLDYCMLEKNNVVLKLVNGCNGVDVSFILFSSIFFIANHSVRMVKTILIVIIFNACNVLRITSIFIVFDRFGLERAMLFKHSFNVILYFLVAFYFYYLVKNNHSAE